MIFSRGNNGEHLWGSSAFEERTGTGKEGSRTLRCRPGGVRKLEVRWPTAHAIGCGPEKDQPRTESAMGKAERPNGSDKTQAHSVSSSAEEDGGCSASEVGQSERSEESSVTTESQVASRPAPSWNPIVYFCSSRRQPSFHSPVEYLSGAFVALRTGNRAWPK
jgi:hypothetical protein